MIKEESVAVDFEIVTGIVEGYMVLEVDDTQNPYNYDEYVINDIGDSCLPYKHFEYVVYYNLWDCIRHVEIGGKFKIFKVESNQYVVGVNLKIPNFIGKSIKLIKEITIDYDDEFLVTKMITVNPNLITRIKNPSLELQKLAISKYYWVISYINSPSDEIKIFAINKNYSSIKHIENPSEELKILSIQSYCGKIGVDFDSLNK